MDNVNSCIKRQEKIDSIVEIINDKNIIAKNLLIKDRIMNPAHYIVMLGETSSGKSSLINSIFEKKILIEKASPTTGTITEVVIENESDEIFLAINKDSSVEELDKDIFDDLVINPDENLHRLRCIKRSKDKKYEGMRIFDTPGYGSLISYHEEVLKEFIPESDFIVYTVSYKSGLGEADYQFLKYVGEIINDDVEIVLAINMCPKDIAKDDKRITKIHEAVNECLHKDIKVFFIEADKEKHPFASHLWDYIFGCVNTEEKVNQLYKILNNCQNYILDDCKIKVMSQIAALESKEKDIEAKLEIDRQLLNEREGILNLIEERFKEIENQSIKLLEKSSKKIINDVENYINDENKWTMKEDAFAYMQNYYIGRFVQVETENISTYIEHEIISLDNEIQNILNTAVKSLERKVEIEIPAYTEVVENILKKHLGDSFKNGLKDVFIKYSGNGGVGAGVANAASKGLKNIGKIFGKTFSRETHNNLKHFLKLIKATSIKGISTYLSVFTEGIFYLYDSLTWKSKLNNWSVNAINKWNNDMEVNLSSELKTLKLTNNSEITELFDELKAGFSEGEKELDDIGLDELINLKTTILNLYKF